MSASSGTVFITGAARGIGRAVAIAFAEAGKNVFLTDICKPIPECPYPLSTPSDLDETVERCRTAGAGVGHCGADVRSIEEVAAAVALCADEFGPVETLVNSAGIVGPGGVLTHELSEAGWQTVLDVNLSGAWRCAQAILPDMVAWRRGSIINVSSTGGLVAFPLFASYVAAKHGLIGLTRALAVEYGPFSIRANAICPTSVETRAGSAGAMLNGVMDMLDIERDDYYGISLQQHPLRRFPTEREIAQLVVWLASEQSAGITGAVVPIDSGFTAR